jgi:hypothetical protein
LRNDCCRLKTHDETNDQELLTHTPLRSGAHAPVAAARYITRSDFASDPWRLVGWFRWNVVGTGSRHSHDLGDHERAGRQAFGRRVVHAADA